MTTVTATEWQTRTMRPILELLVDAGGTLQRSDVQAALREEWQPTDPHEIEIQSNGQERWWSYVAWGTSDLVKTGVMAKDGSGTWSVTDAGTSMLGEIADPRAFANEIRQRARKIRKSARLARADESQRAWLVRGSSVLGASLVPRWLDEGWCSLAASQLPAITSETGPDEIAALAEAAYAHLKHQERVAKVAEIVDFISRMKPGDLVLTTSESGVFVGEIEGASEYESSEDGRSNLRRPVSWRNPEAGVDFADLAATLQAKLRTGSTIADLTGELEIIDNLTSADDDVDSAADDLAAERRRHRRLDPLPADVATKLLVSSQWLDDFVELLNDSRQIVLYGPPGTGKTYLARKIAENLVGTERVRLVQFHPSYTYEDFFEGYRPSGDDRSGTVSLELRPGPLRALASEARDHPERAFVMIIDELNRANIAKVFGELYFLLEYRDDAVEVMYGGEPFTLPKNLYFMCTMNTADRSIALLDSAMRRRFAFLELHPATEPTKSMLPKWLAERELPAMSAELLKLTNSLIDDRDAHIGPSYFMHDDQSAARMRRVFRTQIEPLLQETFYDRWSSLGSRFDFDRLWAEVGSDAAPIGSGSGRFEASNNPVFESVDSSELPSPVAEPTSDT
ncbi:AAA family ATPase [Ilumatobacter nonamiensis]|uniref:AAA family ATPase n=1 Tax=Ilumatobacter nonamiensis TaxID=467093 RepID=UPI00034B2447|nr:AAA family ATPase [Ilumatobacter nonamiensis]